MAEDTVQNARITSTFLGVEDHGILTCVLRLDFGGSGQAVGQYALDMPVHEFGRFVGRRGTAKGMEFVRLILSTLGVDAWEDLKGHLIRIKRGGEGRMVTAIGHIIEDRWLEFGRYWDNSKFVEAEKWKPN